MADAATEFLKRKREEQAMKQKQESMFLGMAPSPSERYGIKPQSGMGDYALDSGRYTGAGPDGVVQPTMPTERRMTHNGKPYVVDEGEVLVIDAGTVNDYGGAQAVDQFIQENREAMKMKCGGVPSRMFTGGVPSQYYRGGTPGTQAMYPTGAIVPNQQNPNLAPQAAYERPYERQMNILREVQGQNIPQYATGGLPTLPNPVGTVITGLGDKKDDLVSGITSGVTSASQQDTLENLSTAMAGYKSSGAPIGDDMFNSYLAAGGDAANLTQYGYKPAGMDNASNREMPPVTTPAPINPYGNDRPNPGAQDAALKYPDLQAVTNEMLTYKQNGTQLPTELLDAYQAHGGASDELFNVYGYSKQTGTWAKPEDQVVEAPPPVVETPEIVTGPPRPGAGMPVIDNAKVVGTDAYNEANKPPVFNPGQAALSPSQLDEMMADRYLGRLAGLSESERAAEAQRLMQQGVSPEAIRGMQAVSDTSRRSTIGEAASDYAQGAAGRAEDRAVSAEERAYKRSQDTKGEAESQAAGYLSNKVMTDPAYDWRTDASAQDYLTRAWQAQGSPGNFDSWADSYVTGLKTSRGDATVNAMRQSEFYVNAPEGGEGVYKTAEGQYTQEFYDELLFPALSIQTEFPGITWGLDENNNLVLKDVATGTNIDVSTGTTTTPEAAPTADSTYGEFADMYEGSDLTKPAYDAFFEAKGRKPKTPEEYRTWSVENRVFGTTPDEIDDAESLLVGELDITDATGDALSTYLTENGGKLPKTQKVWDEWSMDGRTFTDSTADISAAQIYLSQDMGYDDVDYDRVKEFVSETGGKLSEWKAWSEANPDSAVLTSKLTEQGIPLGKLATERDLVSGRGDLVLKDNEYLALLTGPDKDQYIYDASSLKLDNPKSVFSQMTGSAVTIGGTPLIVVGWGGATGKPKELWLRDPATKKTHVLYSGGDDFYWLDDSTDHINDKDVSNMQEVFDHFKI